MPTDHRPEAGTQFTATNGAKKIANRTASVVTDANYDIDIEYEYLEFDTPLPHMSKKFANDASTQALPSTPDLSKYTDPFQWPASRKLTLLWISTVATTFTAYSAGMYAFAIDQLTEEFNVSRVAALAGITIFTAGFGIAPLVLAPFSELTGRRPVFVVTGILWVIFQIFSAVTRLFVGMLLSRLAAGMASSTFSTMVGGVISDMYMKDDRNTPMTIFTAGVLFGTGLGPLCSGFIAQHLSWRWIFWVHAIIVGLLMIAVIFFFYESRGPVLLSRKAKALNKYYEQCEASGFIGVFFEDSSIVRRIRWKVKADEERASIQRMIKISLTRPIVLLFTEPVVFFFSLWISFSWGILYLMFSAVPYVFSTVYNFDLEEQGAVFAGVCVSAILFAGISIYHNEIASMLGQEDKTAGPEGRLRFACVESALVPIGMFIFGWTSYAFIPWIIPIIFGVAIATAGIFSVYLATFNYLADSYGPQASSAIACQSACRNFLGGSFPLFTEIMYQRLTIGGACSLLGGIGALLTLVPWILAWKGPQIRARSRICSKVMQ